MSSSSKKTEFYFFKPEMDIIEKNEFPDPDPTDLKSRVSTHCPEGKLDPVPKKVLAADFFYLTHSPQKNFEVHAKKKISAGAILMEYIGVYSDQTHDPGESAYVMENKEGIQIDASFKGNLARYVNHSCEPNCSILYFWDDRLPRFFITADRAIDRDEEITYDYGYMIEYNGINMICNCGAKNCKKLIGKRMEKKYECEQCDKKFETKKKLTDHLKVHSTEKPHICEECKRPFKRRNALNKHKKVVHGNFKIFCPACGMAFTDKTNRDKHMRLKCKARKSKSNNPEPGKSTTARRKVKAALKITRRTSQPTESLQPPVTPTPTVAQASSLRKQATSSREQASSSRQKAYGSRAQDTSRSQAQSSSSLEEASSLSKKPSSLRQEASSSRKKSRSSRQVAPSSRQEVSSSYMISTKSRGKRNT